MGAVAFIQLQKAFSPEQVEALANFMDTQAATKADLAEVKAELKADIAEIRSEIKLQEQRMTIKLGGMLVVLAGIIIAAFRYLPMAH